MKSPLEEYAAAHTRLNAARHRREIVVEGGRTISLSIASRAGDVVLRLEEAGGLSDWLVELSPMGALELARAIHELVGEGD